MTTSKPTITGACEAAQRLCQNAYGTSMMRDIDKETFTTWATARGIPREEFQDLCNVIGKPDQDYN